MCFLTLICLWTVRLLYMSNIKLSYLYGNNINIYTWILKPVLGLKSEFIYKCNIKMISKTFYAFIIFPLKWIIACLKMMDQI